MSDDPVRLRPIEEADLDLLSRLDTDPAASQPFEWTGFRDPRARRRRWEQDGWLGGDSGQLAVALPDGTLAGIVSWRSIKTGGPRPAACRSAPCYPRAPQQGPWDRGTTTAGAVPVRDHTGQPTPGHHRRRQHRGTEGAGARRVRREGIMRGLAFDGGRWHDAVLYARLRDDPA
jgi:[ribosomal protein S5]-alanine N-acetyltransferase